ncbi:transcription termination/antitermination protein NusG [Patescibacteria group bacterium]|nr:transcription termination/antitermination protein NusG [Patescibacteria group bacterium]
MARQKEEKEVIEETKQKNQETAKGQWYVVHTYSGHENKVATTLKQRIESMSLEGKIFDILVPTQEKIEIREGKKQTIHEKIFPGYILVKMILDDESWHAIRSTAGVTSFVGIGNKPTPLAEKEVGVIMKFMKMEAPKYKATFSIREAVRIIDGPFAEFLGTVDEINEEKGKVKVLVSIFGRETPVELDFLQVSKL